MNEQPSSDPAPMKRWPIALAATVVLVGGAAVGAIGVAAANAAPILTAATSTATASTDANGSDRNGETAVTGAKAETLKAAALKAVPGATVVRVETDADGAVYEVHMTKSDGTRVTVKFDASLNRTAIQTGH